MGGVHDGGAGHGGEPEREQHLAGGNVWWRSNSTDAERERFVSSVVAGWKDDRVCFGAERRFAGVFAFDGRRRAASADEAFDGRGSSEVVSGRKDDCVNIRRVSGMQG